MVRFEAPSPPASIYGRNNVLDSDILVLPHGGFQLMKRKFDTDPAAGHMAAVLLSEKSCKHPSLALDRPHSHPLQLTAACSISRAIFPRQSRNQANASAEFSHPVKDHALILTRGLKGTQPKVALQTCMVLLARCHRRVPRGWKVQ